MDRGTVQRGATGRTGEDGARPPGEAAEETGLDARQLRAVDLWLAGRTVPEVAAELGVNRSTAWRWAAHPAARRELARLRGARRGALGDGLDAAALDAVAVLAGLLRDGSATTADRLRAATAVLDRAGWASGRAEERPGGVEAWGDREAGGELATAAEPGSDEWLAEQVELAAALPPHVVAEAGRRQKGT